MRLDRRLTHPRRAYPLSGPRRSARSRGGLPFWLSVAALGILGALGVLLFHVLAFARSLDRLPPGLVVGGVPVAGLTAEQAEARLRAVYLSPVVLDYEGSQILLDPVEVNFQINTKDMLAQAPAWELSGSAWEEFWAYLWNRTPPAPEPIALQAGYDVERLRRFLADVAARYDAAGEPARADPDTLGFIPGSAGIAPAMAPSPPTSAMRCGWFCWNVTACVPF